MNIHNLTKKVASLALGTTVLFASVTGVSAATYTVKSGDTLSAIAKKYNTSYTAVMKENGLSSTNIRIGQKLHIGEKTSTGTTVKAKSTASTSKTTYIVKSGDTLSGIAKKYGIKYTAIMSSNNLKSTAIKIGQKLTITSTTTVKASTTTTKVAAVSKGTKIRNVAEQYLGTPYVFGGNSPAGFDCSGFVYYVLKKSGTSISRTNANGFYNMAKKVSTPQVGDLVFFSNTYKAGISHIGIYIGSGKMISASGSKVNITTFQSGYWKSHFTSYGRI